jgi:hypothetical protein
MFRDHWEIEPKWDALHNRGVEFSTSKDWMDIEGFDF